MNIYIERLQCQWPECEESARYEVRGWESHPVDPHFYCPKHARQLQEQDGEYPR